MTEYVLSTPARHAWWKQDWFLAVLLAVATFLTYQPAWSGEAVYDDDDHLTPPELQSVSGLGRIWTRLGVVSQYYPIVHTAFWVEHRLWGDSMTGYHLTNLLLHVLCALLLVRILKRLEVPGEWLAAALFALHPVEVESVAWISELKNTLSTLFYLGAALAYLKFDGTRRKGFYAAALALFVCGLLSKSVIASLPAALLVVFWWKRGMLSWSRDARPLVPFFAIAILSGLFTVWIERKFIGAEGDVFSLSFAQRCLIAGRAVWFYLGKLFWPADLTFIYPRWQVSAAVWWQYLFPLAALLLTIALWAVRKRSRAPLAALLLFAGTLFPALGFLNVYPFRYSFVADHYQYLASISIIVLVTAGLAKLVKSEISTRALSFALLVALAVLSWNQSRMYSGIETVWRTTIARNPSGFVAHSNLGNYLLDHGRVDEAIDQCRQAVELEPRAPEVHNNLGNALRARGRTDDALREYHETLRLRPNFAQARFNLGAVFLERGQVDEALVHFQNAVKSRPEFVKAQNNLGDILLRKGRVDDALVHLQKAFEIRPDDPEVLINLGNALLQKGRTDDAIKQYRHALALAPDSELAHYNLGCAFFQQGRLDDAIAQFQKAVELKPDFVPAQFYLGNAFLRRGDTQRAVARFRVVLKLDPDNPDALALFAWTLATWPDVAVRNGAEAIELAKRANQVTGNRNPGVLRALAAAYAEGGRFDEAVASAKQALTLAGYQNDGALVDALKSETKFYEAGSPFRQQ